MVGPEHREFGAGSRFATVCRAHSSHCANSTTRSISGIFSTVTASRRPVFSTSPGSRQVASSFLSESWKKPEIRLLALRRAARNDDGTVSLLTLLLNPTAEDHAFRMADPVLPAIVLIDTARPDAESAIVTDNKLEVLSRSAVLVYARLEKPAQ